MGRQEKEAYVEAIRPRYRVASREAKKTILDEMSATMGCHRKAVIRMIGRANRQHQGAKQHDTGRVCQRRAGRPSRIRPQDLEKLERLVRACDWPCGRRLQAMLPLWIEHDAARYQDYEPSDKEHLLSLGSATLDRHLRAPRRRAGMRGRSGTKPGSLLREQIPIQSGPWNVEVAGYLEADTVAHCGHSLGGQFVWSLTVTDIHTGWTECRAIWHKGVLGIRDAIIDIDCALPFNIKGFDCDNGSEFLNKTLINYFQTHPDKPSFTRSRPYKKNDNAHVEQKNWTHVRQLFGYQRLAERNVVAMMNDLYRKEVTWMNNLFTPSMKLISKTRVGSKIVKRYDDPQTPFQRLMKHSGCQAEKDNYQTLVMTLNPLELRETIRAKTRAIIAACSVT